MYIVIKESLLTMDNNAIVKIYDKETNKVLIEFETYINFDKIKEMVMNNNGNQTLFDSGRYTWEFSVDD